MHKKSSPHIELAHTYWKRLLRPEDTAIDATCGNGHDTLFLSELCHVAGLDIQPQAIETTKILLARHEKKGDLHLLSHSKIDTLPYSPRLIVYNLGYLPKGDKSITTKLESTLEAVQKSLNILQAGGALSITCYPGHDEGLLEEQALETWAASLPSHQYLVCHHKWINRIRAPSLLWIEALQK